MEQKYKYSCSFQLCFGSVRENMALLLLAGGFHHEQPLNAIIIIINQQ